MKTPLTVLIQCERGRALPCERIYIYIERERWSFSKSTQLYQPHMDMWKLGV